MSNPWGLTVLPLHLAKRMVQNRGGEAIEREGRLEIWRSGQFLYAPVIHDGCVNYLSICGTFAVHPRS